MSTLSTFKGFDVSANNGTIDWTKVGKQPYDFVMARAAYGKTSKDKQLKANVAGAQAHGLDVGAYLFSYASSVSDAQKEAQNLLTAVSGLHLTYPLVYDLENNSYTTKVQSQWTDMALAFLNIVQNAGYYAMLYSNTYSLENIYDMEKLAAFDVWVAQWAPKVSYEGEYGIWQYSDSGAISGISGNVDKDVAYKDYAEIIRSKRLNRL
ncbi:MAG: glycoside hydrolase family 25 protein [Oscillospiraceae bacterium]|nr:glycoside hydrolase family 25 protein [Oscillospiraceae bacterium]